ncbi:hypothetical protein K1T71_015150 [Dendrolimus kikuchii]|nr:hypothetical protein K1T71_015150 [Dendrolimus kikuchii]
MTMSTQKDKSVFNKIKSLFPKFNAKKKDKKPDIKDDKVNDTTEIAERKNVVNEIVKNFDKIEIDPNARIESKNVDCKKDSKAAVDKILQNFQSLHIKVVKQDEDNDDEAFTKKFVEDDRRSERIDSHSSEDSGFADIKEEIDDVIETPSKNDKEKRVQKVVTSRQPIRLQLNDRSAASKPYPVQGDHNYRQEISQINKHTLTGGQVLVNPNLPQDNFSEVDIALKICEQVSRNAQKEQASTHWQDVMEIIHKDNTVPSSSKKEVAFQTDPMYQSLLSPPSDDILSDFMNIQQESFGAIHFEPHKVAQPNPIEEFDERSQLPNYEECVEISKLLELDDGITSLTTEEELSKSFMFPTPPRSENVPSPRSESQTSFYRPNSEYTLSPERLSPFYTSDYEKYQEIYPFEEFPQAEEKVTSAVNTMTMKRFKDLQKEISYDFSKKDCCQLNKKSCKDVLKDHMQKLKEEDRRNLCFNVAKLDLKTAYGVLHRIILSLQQGADQEDLQLALFGLICERVLAQKPSLFTADFGLSLLKSAALRCPHKPFLTRYLVQCTRTALKMDPDCIADKEFVFREVASPEDGVGAAGCYTALHVACSQHSTAEPKLHVIHVLLEHGGADIWKGDVKGGDTALHVAVNSANCDLHLVLMIFKQVHRKEWKKLAHCHNMSSVTSLEYARSATKSTTRQKYPPEVLDFLKRCR